jgi:hypothetical protein
MEQNGNKLRKEGKLKKNSLKEKNTFEKNTN